MAYTNVPIAAAGDWIDDAYINTYLGDNFRAIFSSLTAAGQLLASTAINALTKVAVTGNNGYILTEDTSLAAKMKFAAPPTGLPAAGSALQYVRKNAANNGYEWASLVNELPAGGTALQYLRKNAANNAYEWATLSDGFPGSGAAAYKGLRIGSDGTTREWAALVNLISRQGGSASVWNTSGSTTRAVAAVVMQVGCISASISGAYPTAVTTAVTFPTAFSNKPLVFIIPAVANTTFAVGIANNTADISASGFTLSVAYESGSSGSGNIDVFWLAIGPP